MARIPRKHQKIFAGSASNNGIFGSAQTGDKDLSNDLDDIQSLPAWDSGWNSATISSQRLPTLEEMQAIQYLQTSQLAYLFQEGIPEYLAACTYYEKSLVRKSGTYEIYGSLIDDNTGNALPDGVSDSNWEYLTNLSPTAASALTGAIAGAYISNGTDTDHDLDISVGGANDDANGVFISLATAITKQIDAAWAEGDDAGGLDAGSVASDSTYHVFLISKEDGTTDALISLSKTTPTMPSGYLNKRRIGSIMTDASANIEQFVRSGDTYYWKTVERDISSTITTTGTNFVVRVPLGLNVIHHANIFVAKAGSTQSYVFCPDITDQAADNAVTGFSTYSPVSGGADTGQSGQLDTRTNTSGQIRAKSTSSGVTFYVSTLGFTDKRED